MSGAAIGDGGSTDVFVNDMPSLREGDSSGVFDFETVSAGSPTVYVNDKPKARIGDPLTVSSISSGSSDVDVGP